MSETLIQERLPDTLQALTGILDGVRNATLDRDRAALVPLLRGLSDIRRLMTKDVDVIAGQGLVQSHAAFPILMEDPYTLHAFEKPRGFGGDASLIDLIYGHRSGSEAHNEGGRFLFETMMRFPSCESVRYRRGYYGAFIDRVTGERDVPDVLALACGHLREARFSRAVRDRGVRLTGIDSDPQAIAEAAAALGPYGVVLRHASVIDFVRRRAWGETYDAVYAAGLFDYLNERIAKRVVAAAYASLRPGGTLSVANYLPDLQEQGYMDLVMDWRLIYRTPEDMLALAGDLPEGCEATTWTDPLDCVVYLTVVKAA